MKVFCLGLPAIVILLLSPSCLGQRPPPGGGGGRPGGGGGNTCNDTGLIQCPMEPPYMTATITTDDTFRYVRTDTCPVYSSEWTNPNEACMLETTYRIPLVPTAPRMSVPVGQVHSVYQNITYLQEDPAPILGPIGVMVSGVNIYGVGSPCGFSSVCPNEGAPTNYVDAIESEGRTIDACGGHASPFNDYHVHSGQGIMNATGRQACGLPVDVEGEHSELLGWMLDGYGLYGHFSLNGEVPTDLDTCGGHTHLLNGEMTYHYHLPDSFPWIIGCFTGCPEISNNRQLQFATGEEYGCPEAATEATPTTDDVGAGTNGGVRVVCELGAVLLGVLVSLLQ